MTATPLNWKFGILGDQIEINLVRAIMTDSDPWLFLTRPISGGLLAASVLSVAFALWQHRQHQKRAATARGEADFYRLRGRIRS